MTGWQAAADSCIGPFSCDTIVLPVSSEDRPARAGPALSIVVLSDGPLARLEAALAPLVPACRAVGVEVVVARAEAGSEVDDLTRNHPDVHFAFAAAGAPEAELRVLGMTTATGDIVRLIDDRQDGVDWTRTLMSWSGVLTPASLGETS